MQRGPAIRVWLIMSGVGVRIAAMMKLTRMAYFRFFDRNWGVTTPIRLRIVITTGSSKTMPKASANLITKSVYDDTVSMGFQPFSCPKVTRKVEAYGTMMSIAKVPPMRKRRDPMMMKGAAYFFSCAWSPGETNFQTWKRMPGMEMKMPSTMATFIQVQKASVGEVKTRSVFMLMSGREMKRMTGSVMKSAMTIPTAM